MKITHEKASFEVVDAFATEILKNFGLGRTYKHFHRICPVLR